ncbi:hypothetical protein AURDEDRAFT_161485 [Auricularia subglabra TFB-10046 SS5]|nr:hypothetical protein AURDEDRAFT_161485 [Auricularia subglabra TFB-10046 SS5]
MWVQSIRRVYKSGRGIAPFRHRLYAGCSQLSSSYHHHLHLDFAAAIETSRGDPVRSSALPAAPFNPGGDDIDGAFAHSPSCDPSPTPQSVSRYVAVHRSSLSTSSPSMTESSIIGRSNGLFSSQSESSNTLASSHSARAGSDGRARQLSDPPEHITDGACSICSTGWTRGHRQLGRRHLRRTLGFGWYRRRGSVAYRQRGQLRVVFLKQLASGLLPITGSAAPRSARPTSLPPPAAREAVGP